MDCPQQEKAEFKFLFQMNTYKIKPIIFHWVEGSLKARLMIVACTHFALSPPVDNTIQRQSNAEIHKTSLTRGDSGTKETHPKESKLYSNQFENKIQKFLSVLSLKILFILSLKLHFDLLAASKFCCEFMPR